MYSTLPFFQRRPNTQAWTIGLVLLLFFMFYSSICLVNHYNYRSSNLDLGLYNQTLHSFAHLEWGKLTLLFSKHDQVWMLGDHFSPMILVISPLYHVMGSYTLLVVQMMAILLGGLGGYKLARHYGLGHMVAMLVMVQFLSIWAITSALAFDFHTNVPAAMCVPWIILFYLRGDKKKFILVFITALLWKENMALWLVFILLGLIIHVKRQWRDVMSFELPLMISALVYFVVVMEWVMPALAGSEDNLQLVRYGGSLSGLIQWVFTAPLEAFHELFAGDTPDDMRKTEFHFMLLVSGGVLLFRRPEFLLMCVPILAQKMFSTQSGMWGIGSHYSIEFVPLISLAAIAYISTMKKKWVQVAVSCTLLISTGLFHVTSINYRHLPWYKKTKLEQSPFLGEHYDADLCRNSIRTGLDMIPEHASVSASTTLGPHLPEHRLLYHFPVTEQADYVAVILDERSYYPLHKPQFEAKLLELVESGEYSPIYRCPDMVVMKRVDKVRPTKKMSFIDYMK